MSGQNITWTVSNWRVATTGPATGATWIKCAAEGATCAYTGAKLVRYGLGNTFFFTQGTGGTLCSTATFGEDPLANIAKECWYADLFSSTGLLALRPMARGTVTVTASLTDNAAISTTAPLTIGLGTVTKWGAYCNGRCNGTLAVGAPETMWPVPWDSLFNVLAVPIKATSSNPAVATVAVFTAKQYILTPLSAGTATITFAPDSAFAGATYPTTYTVTVP